MMYSKVTGQKNVSICDSFLFKLQNSFLCNKIIMLKYVKQSYVNSSPHRETPLQWMDIDHGLCDGPMFKIRRSSKSQPWF